MTNPKIVPIGCAGRDRETAIVSAFANVTLAIARLYEAGCCEPARKLIAILPELHALRCEAAGIEAGDSPWHKR